MYVADFETTDSDSLYEINEKNEYIYNQRVWLAGFKNLETMESTYFYNLDDFMKAILSRGDNMNTEYAFHNIKFDGSYIVPWLFSNGYYVSEGKPQSGQFSILVDNRNNWYSLTIQVTKRRKVTLWDSLKLFPMALEYLPDVYGTPTHKIIENQEFYTKKRDENYISDEEDLMYFENDLQVPAETLNKHIELYGLRFKKTQASQAFYNFEKVFPAWKLRFPALSLEDDNDIRTAYWGGISHVPSDKASKDHYNIGVYDINSSYPDKAANFKLPYGNCLKKYGEGLQPDMSKFWVAEALVEFKLKENCLPCIPSKAIIEGRPLEVDKWVENSQGIVKLKFCCIDYLTMVESYEIKVYRWIWSMHWAWKVHREVAKFVNINNDKKVKYSKLAKLEKDKKKKTEYNTIRNRAKIDNNAFYGKFGEEVIKEGKTPYSEGSDVVWKTDRKDTQTEYKRKYLPVAIAITAWGRRQLVIMANLLGKYFLYCDTDSIHYLKEGGQAIVDAAIKKGLFSDDPEKLGSWKYEGTYKRGRYLRAKCYMEENEKGELEATVAGLPADKHSGSHSKKRSYLNWENFFIGLIIPEDKTNKLRTVHTATGNKLLPTPFKINQKFNLFF